VEVFLPASTRGWGKKKKKKKEKKLFPNSGEGKRTPTLLGPLDRANLEISYSFRISGIGQIL
jgi:hypothetical protein